MKKALVLSSGGVDSTTCVSIAIDELGKENVTTVSVYYKQKHSKELECAEKIADYYGVDHKIIDLSATHIFDDSKCSLLQGSDEDIPEESYADQIAKLDENKGVSTFVPYRNGLLLSSVAALAVSMYPDDDVDIYIGAHADDAAGNALCRLLKRIYRHYWKGYRDWNLQQGSFESSTSHLEQGWCS